MSLANLDQYLTIPAVPTIPSSLPPSGPAGGDLTGTYPNPTLIATGPGATGPIGDATHSSQVTIDAKGRVTALASVAITGTAPGGTAGGSLSGTYPNPGTSASYAATYLSLTTTSTVTVGNGTDAADQLIVMSAKAGQRDQLAFQTAGLSRWSFFKGNGAESGANAGSSLIITASDDAGTAIDNPLVITRASAGTIALGGSSARPITMSGALSVVGTTTLGTASAATGTMVFQNATNAFGVTIQSGVTTPGSYTLTLPLAQGAASSFLQNNGSGVLSWATATAGNLTGPITSVGLATSIASQTGTGTKFVVDTSPTLVTPILGVATATSLQAIIGNVTPAAGTFTGVTGSGASAVFGTALFRSFFTGTTAVTTTGFTHMYRTGGTLETIGSLILQSDPGQATGLVALYTGTTPAWVAKFATASAQIGQIASTYTGAIIAGVQTSLAAVAGQVGEVITGTNQTTYTNITTTATYQNMATISLTAGDWLLTALVSFQSNGATLGGNADFGISNATASLAGSAPYNTEGQSIIYIPAGIYTTLSVSQSEYCAIRISVSVTTTVYFVGRASFTVGNPRYTAGLFATRMR